MRKIRLMHIVQSPGGVARYLSMLLKHMDREAFCQILVCSQDYNADCFIDKVDAFEIVVMDREISLRKDIKSIKSLREVIKRYDPDTIYLHSSKAGALGRIAAMGFGKKIIYNPHGWSFNMNDCSTKKKNIYRWIEKILACFTDKIIAISDWEKKCAVDSKICSSNKIQVIYSGIDVDEYYLNKDCFKVNRVMLGIPDDAYVIGMVGRISYGKGPDIFVRSAKLIKRDIPNAYFLIVGDGEERSSIENLLKEEGLDCCTIITGWVTNPMEYISLFDQAMLLTRWEGFGLVLTEYMISRKPIITTNVGAVPNLITMDKEGVLVSVDDINQVYCASLKIYKDSDYRNKLINNSLLKVEQQYNVKRTAKEHEKMLLQLVSKISE